MARTQQRRREETIGRLLEACITSIVEVGYARASAAVITKRAEVSVGALFRHFETMGDFMAGDSIGGTAPPGGVIHQASR